MKMEMEKEEHISPSRKWPTQTSKPMVTEGKREKTRDSTAIKYCERLWENMKPDKVTLSIVLWEYKRNQSQDLHQDIGVI